MNADPSLIAEMLAESYRACFSTGQGLREGHNAERARIRQELETWLIGDLPREDIGLFNGRRVVDEIDRICPKAATATTPHPQSP